MKNNISPLAFLVSEDDSKTIGQKIQSAYLATQVIRSACEALEGTVFTSPEEKPDWFDSLNKKLMKAQQYAQEWNSTGGISKKGIIYDLTQFIPGQIENYDSTFKASISVIEKLFENNPDAGNNDKTMKSIYATLQVLDDQIEEIKGDVDKAADMVTKWGQSMQQAHNELSDGTTNIQEAEVDLQADIGKMNTEIASLKAKIATYNKVAIGSGAAIGVGAFICVAGIAFAFVTFGAGAVVAGIGALIALGGIGTLTAMEVMINQSYDKIAKDQKELKQDQRQLVALKSLELSSQQAVDNIQTALDNLGTVKTAWAMFQNEINTVKDNIEKGATAKDILHAELFSVAAQNMWNQAVLSARQLTGFGGQEVKKTMVSPENSTLRLVKA